MNTAWANFVYAVRTLRKNPSFSLTVMLVLGLAIGGNVGIFSIVNAVMLRPLPYRDSDRLVLLWGNVQRTVVERRGGSFPDYRDWKEQNRTFDGLAVFFDDTFTLTKDDERTTIRGEIVGADYFRLLGIKPIAGRTFHPSEEWTVEAPPVVAVSHDFWTQNLGSNPSVLGTTLLMNNIKFTIVGVLPPGFRGLEDQAELWVPPGALPGVQEGFSARGSRGFAVLGKLREGITLVQAQEDMNSISSSLERAYPETNEKRGVEVASLVQETFGNVRPALLLLLVAIGMVLLIACANLANLMLLRTETRNSEIAIRMAIGASRVELIKLILSETVLLSLLSGVLGLLLSGWLVDAMLAASPVQLPSFVNVNIDGSVVLFAIGLALAAGMLMSIAACLHSAPAVLNDVLKSNSTRTSSDRSAKHFRNGLVVGEVALTVVLLIGAGLLIESFRSLLSVDPGFRPTGLVGLRIGLSSALSNTVREAIAHLPGVESVALSSGLPYSGGSAIFYTAEGQAGVDATNVPRAFVHRITPAYFRTMGIPVVAGRDFATNENALSVIVSQDVVKRFWPGEEGIGKRIKSGRVDADSPWLNIVGVAGNTKTRGLPNNPTADPDLYFPLEGQTANINVLIRTVIEPTSVMTSVRSEIRKLDKAAVLTNVASMDEVMRPLMSRPRFLGWLSGIFSGMALLLAAVGIYGTISSTVTRRTREIGVRMAVGANRGDVIRMVLRHCLALIVSGLVLGLLSAVAVGRGISTLLFGISATDPSVFIGVSVVMIFIGLIAACIPAWRAAQVDPLKALRE